MDKVGGSFGIFYGYVGVIGLAIYAVLRWFQANVSLAAVWCTYGGWAGWAGWTVGNCLVYCGACLVCCRACQPTVLLLHCCTAALLHLACICF